MLLFTATAWKMDEGGALGTIFIGEFVTRNELITNERLFNVEVELTQMIGAPFARRILVIDLTVGLERVVSHGDKESL